MRTFLNRSSSVEKCMIGAAILAPSQTFSKQWMSNSKAISTWTTRTNVFSIIRSLAICSKVEVQHLSILSAWRSTQVTPSTVSVRIASSTIPHPQQHHSNSRQLLRLVTTMSSATIFAMSTIALLALWQAMCSKLLMRKSPVMRGCHSKQCQVFTILAQTIQRLQPFHLLWM